MEKGKGIFPFRKHPAGEFLNGKKGRKRKENRLWGTNARAVRRALGLLLSAALIFNTLPASGFAVSASEGEKTEVQEVTGEKVITAWEWIDPEEYLTDGMLALPGAGRENPAFAEDVTALLPEKIQAKAAVDVAEDGEETEEDAEALSQEERMEITLTGWECASYPEDGAYEGTYTFTASLPEGFVLAEDVAGLEVKVELGGAEMLSATVSAAYREASWTGSEVTYADKTADSCTPVADNADAVTWDADWYVVNSTVTISEPITINGAVNLILADGCTLNAEKGIVVETGNSLTIYAQSGGTGTLNATGVFFYDETTYVVNASAGIGGSGTVPDSGLITIHGGVINATGGGQSNYHGGAGIGGGSSNSGNGGSSGAITIYGGTITGNSGAGGITGAGIGGGGGDTGGAGSNITIYGGSVTAASIDTSTGGAGIGGGSGFTRGGGDSNIQIHGGTVNATGGYMGAGIGGGADSAGTSGNGTVTISGGTVTAVGGRYAAGIGGGGGYSTQYGSCTGGTGSVTISGGIVDATGGAGNSSGNYAGDPIGNGGNTTAAATVSKTTGIVFENGVGTVCGDVTLDESYDVPGGYTLNIPAGASLSGSGTLSGGSAFTTENLTADMISVPDNLYYNGEDRTEALTNELSAELTTGVTICGQTFTVGGWTLAVEKTGDLTYTATYTNNNDSTKTFTKTITLLKSGTKFEGDVKTYNGDTQTTTFNADDTITIKAAPTATGTAPTKAEARLRGGYTEPTAGQMALFVGDVQVSEPVEAGADGIYTMTASASKVLLQGNAEPNGNAITLTAKFVGNDNMADAAGTVKVNISAVARVEKDSTTTYVGALGDAFTDGNSGAMVTLLAEVELTNCIQIKSGLFTLDLNGHTVKCINSTAILLDDFCVGLTIRGSGSVQSEAGNAVAIEYGTLTLEGGNFSSERFSGVWASATSGALNVNSADVTINGLSITNANTDISLAAGTYTGEPAIEISRVSKTLDRLLADGCAFYNGDTPIALQPDGKELTGTVTVKECNHTGEGVCTYAHIENTSTHTKTCLACGETWTAENCTYTFSGVTGTCAACGDSVTVAVSGTENLIYDGTGKKPGVTVTRADTELTAGTDYTVAYADNIDAGTAKVTVTIGNEQGTYTGNFSIGKASLTITASAQTITYGGSITTDTDQVTSTGLASGDTLESVTLTVSSNQVAAADKTITPSGAKIQNSSGTDVTGNYEIAYQPGALTINKSQPTIAFASGYNPGKDYDGQAIPDPAADNLTITGADFSDVAFAWSATPRDAGTYTLTAAIPETTNTEAASNTMTVTISPKNVTPAITITPGSYEYTDRQIKPGEDANTTVTVKDGDTVISASEYTLSYGGNTQVGEGSVTVTDKENGNYTIAQATETFTITKANQATLTITGAPGSVTYGDTFQLGVSGSSGSGAVSWAAAGATVDNAGNVTITRAGTVIITAMKDGDGNYFGTEAKIMLNVSKKALAVSGVDAQDRAYDGTNKVEITAVTLDGIVGSDTVEVDVSGIQGTLSSANAGIYTEVTLPELTLTGKDSGNYTLVQPAAAVPTSVEITPLDAVITIGTDTYHKTFSDATFTLDVTDNNTEADVQYEVAKGTDVVSMENGTVAIQSAGTAEIKVSLPASTNYHAAENKTITITVDKKSGYTVDALNRSYYYKDGGTDSIDLAALLPEDSGNVSYGEPAASGNVAYSAAPAVSGGKLSYTLDSGNANEEGTITVTVATQNYEDITVMVNVKLNDQIPVSLKDGTEVTLKNSVLTYGEPLSDLAFNEAEFATADGTAVTGTLAWKEAAAAPDAGTASAVWVFTPAEDKYASLEGTAAITVKKAKNAPNMPGSTMDVPNSFEKAGDVPLPEGWEWQASDKDTALEAGSAVSAVAVYTGADKGNYEKETVTVAITRSVYGHVAGDDTAKPGDDITKPGDDTAKPGDTKPDGGSAETRPDTGIPFIKDEDGKSGWDVIRAEEEKAEEGSVINVDMNQTTVVPGNIFDGIKGKDITITFDMGGAITWSVNGKDIAEETAGDRDFSIKADAGAIPEELIEEKAAGLAHLELSLAHEGAFGFTAALTLWIVSRDGNGITVGSSGTAAGCTGMYANLFYYNPDLHILEFICAGQIGEDGTVDLPFVHASDYTVILSAYPMEGTGMPEEAEQEPVKQAGVKSVKLSKTWYTYNGKPKKPSVAAIDTEGRKISSRYYTVSYKNNKKAGKATAIIKFKGGYSKTVKKTFTIRPAGTFMKKPAAVSGGFTVKWKKKTAQTSGYQIQYSADAGFKRRSTGSIFVKKNSKTKKMVKHLKAGKKYYLRIRTYKTVKAGGKNIRIYSVWSKACRGKTLPAASRKKTAAPFHLPVRGKAHPFSIAYIRVYVL